MSATAAAAVKLSPALKALIAAPHALGRAIPAPSKTTTTSLFDNIRRRGRAGGIASDTWLTTAAASLVTINSPETICALFDWAARDAADTKAQVQAAGVIRETALKCISFSGIPRTINALVALRAHLPDPVKDGLSTSSLRLPTPGNIEEISTRGRGLWDAIYEPHSVKLLAKLAEAHPDLPVHILNSHYGPNLSDPLREFPAGHAKVGRVLTSVVAIACLRTQQGVAPQLTSHVFGLKKALLPGGGGEGEPELQGQDWLTSDEGVTWVMETADEISEVVGGGRSTFAGGMEKAKL